MLRLFGIIGPTRIAGVHDPLQKFGLTPSLLGNFYLETMFHKKSGRPPLLVDEISWNALNYEYQAFNDFQTYSISLSRPTLPVAND